MASPYEDPSVTVFGEYSAEYRLTVASFVWPTPSNPDTYTIAPTSGLSLELDRQFPVRLAKIALYDDAEEGSIELVSLLVGEDVSEQMHKAPGVGQFVMNTTINLDSRLLLAHLQAHNPSTPPSMRRAVVTMLMANDSLDIAPQPSVQLPMPSASGGDVSDLPPAA